MFLRWVIAVSHACSRQQTGNDRAFARRQVVLDTLGRAGVQVPDAWMLETVYSISDSKQDASRLFSQPGRPTALICGNDILATGALYGATANGLTVPGDVTVVGIGDFKGSSEIEPALTTVRLPARRIGQEAGDVLVSAIVEPAGGMGRSLNCAPELVVRKSSAPYQGSAS